MTLTKFCTERLDEDEWWAREASRHHDNPVPDGGHHWQWVDVESDQAITPDPVASHYVEPSEGGFQVSLRSVEQYPCNIPGTLPQFAISSAEEVPVAVGGHIARHDPARALRQVEAGRRTLARHKPNPQWADIAALADACMGCGITGPFDDPDTGHMDECPELRNLASIWADHDDYLPRWKI